MLWQELCYCDCIPDELAVRRKSLWERIACLNEYLAAKEKERLQLQKLREEDPRRNPNHPGHNEYKAQIDRFGKPLAYKEKEARAIQIEGLTGQRLIFDFEGQPPRRENCCEHLANPHVLKFIFVLIGGVAIIVLLLCLILFC
ncbi:hypothetical protein L596_025850 [Steinernema carpocapsae]|uniref:Uncharacterized protein n=1 Tax=Steinernema carpocapsae TaxID=34508 RepID=A0A4V5ZYY3_STECR|nr:hypothetical protein L596_025850 [Steinernema carpocapsae]